MSITISSPVVKAGRASQANFVLQCLLALDSSYPSGGYALASVFADHDAFPSFEILHVFVEPKLPYTFGWDRTNNKLVVYEENGTSGVTAEVAPSTDLHTVTGLFATVMAQ